MVRDQVLGALAVAVLDVHVFAETGTPGLENVSPVYLGALYDDVKASPLPLKGWDGEADALSASCSVMTTVARAVSTGLAAVKASSSRFFTQLFEEL